MAFNIKDWLKTDMQMSDEDVALVAGKLEPKAALIEGGILRQQDYSAKMNEVTKLQGDIEAKDRRLTDEMAEWGSLTAAEKAQNTALRTSIEALESDKLKLTQRLTRVASEAGIDPKSVLADIEAEPVPKPAAAAAPIDTSKFATLETMNGVAAMALEMPAVLHELAEDHRELFGARLNTTAIMAEIKQRAATRGNQKSLDPRAVWEELNNVPAKREAVAKVKYDTEITAAVERGRQTAITEMSVPGNHTPVGRSSPVLVQAGGHKSAVQRPQPGQGVQSAVAAFSSGKYRQGASTKTA